MHDRKAKIALKTIHRNVNTRGASGEVTDGHEEHVIGNGGEVILVIKGQRPWLSCVPVF